MRAFHCVKYGEPRDLVLVDIAEPVASPGEVVIKVEAAGLGFVDALHVRGGYQVKKPLPFIPGSEIAGTVIAAGDAAGQHLVGKRVVALSHQGGGLAERAVVSAHACTVLPDAFTSAAAASSLVNYATGIYGLENCGVVQVGETVLILGASGGVGMAALDIAKGIGAKVIAAASSNDKLAACKAAGADYVINYTNENWRKELETQLDGQPINLIYDPAGGQWSETAFRCLAPGGRHLVVGFAGGDIPRIPLNLPLLKRASIVGVDWGGYVRADPKAQGPLIQRLLDLVQAGKINPQPGATFKFEDAPAVLESLVNRTSIGKPVILIG